MALSPWLILALAVLVIGSLLLFIWRRRRAESFAACPRCMTVFDPDAWKIRNIRKHYQGRYTITPVFICPKCAFEMAPAQF